VMVFFVLSGFLISSSIIKDMLERKWSWKRYLVNRITRLWIVLIPSLLFGYAIAKFSIAIFHTGSRYADTLRIKYLFSNMFFLQFRDGKIFGYNLPLWSLANEFWYYLLFPSVLSIFYYRNKLLKLLFGHIHRYNCAHAQNNPVFFNMGDWSLAGHLAVAKA
jgi:peptidoglycan/LPS O-acetylase OafA/YrhL